MKTLKSVLALVMALCLMMCLAVPALATNDPTETTNTSTESTEPTTGETPTGETTDGSANEESTPAEGEESGDGHNHDEETDANNTTTTGTNTNTNTGAEDKNKVLRTVLLILEVIASVALIVVVLLQSGKESGLGGAIAGNSDSYMNKNKKGGMDKMLASATKWVALVWIVLTLALGLI